MNPNREGQSSFELPPEAQPSPEAGQQGQEQTVEAPLARPEQVGKQPPQPVLPAVPQDIPAVDQPVIAVPPDDITGVAPTSFAQAKDSDHIESQWVDKAKSVIAHTQEDPYMQKHEMSRVKAEYIQKRFGKQIKTDEAAV